MAASDDNIRQLRRMIAEPTQDTYTDTDLAAYIEAYPLMDADGYDPDEDEWTAVYDLHAAASVLWTEKASCSASSYDTSSDFSRQYKSQVMPQMLKMARFHAARRAVAGVVPVIRPREVITDVWIGNLPEVDL